MIVTDGEPNPTSQNPCEWAQRYLDEGIEIIGVAIGITKEQFGFDCLDQESIFESYSSLFSGNVSSQKEYSQYT